MKINLVLLGLLIIMGCTKQQPDILDTMVIAVDSTENRPVSFTNKQSAYYYTQSHINNHHEWAWFEGLNIAKKKIFQGYELLVNGERLNNQNATVRVYPYKMTRNHSQQLIEELILFDNKNLLEISVKEAKKDIGIHLKGKQVSLIKTDNNIVFLQAMEGNNVIGVSSKYNTPVLFDSGIVMTNQKSGGFFIAVGKNQSATAALIKSARDHHSDWKKERKNRMRQLLLKNTFLQSDNDSLAMAMNWLVITMDQLVTRQQGYGIYAGLPWFNEYWGRDEFIALPGACLVSGQFKWARKILNSFAEYQETDPTAKFFGRVPNIVNPENIDYHTTDGTPRFVIQLQEYVKYSGDKSIIRDLYNNVKYSIEGSLKNWTDKNGYLVHAHNETWMDARRAEDLMPYSPRGNRANDIQALWHKQLLAGVYFANYMDDEKNAQKWQTIADKLKSNFQQDFTDDDHNFLADRLTKSGEKDFKIRPNQLFTFDMLAGDQLKWKALKVCWEELVYPWGVASLDRKDDYFHPFHASWENYHKDEAYHNGTIWLWNNGIAIQRMIEAEQPETAYQLFKNMNQQALTRGVVGGLCENMDAYPRPGKNWPKITGTYLQAWSNSEHLRVWYQYFLGIQPDMINNELKLVPRLPSEIKNLSYEFLVGDGSVGCHYSNPGNRQYDYRFHSFEGKVRIDCFPFENISVTVNDGHRLHIQEQERSLRVTHFRPDGEQQFDVPIDKKKLAKKSAADSILSDIKFCNPIALKNHAVLDKTYER